MKTRKLTLVLIAVLALSLSMLGVVSAASRGQDVPADADRTAAGSGNPGHTAAIDALSETDHRPRPEWLKKVHVFLRTFPSAVDGSLRLLDEDGEVRTFVVMPGEVLGIGETEISVQDKLGEVHFFPFTDGTVFYARYHQVRPGMIEAGMKVAILTVDGDLRAVVVTSRADGDERPGRDEDRMAKLRERLAEIDARFDERVAELDEKAEERIAELRAKAAERKADLEEKLRERLANAAGDDWDEREDDDDDNGDDDDEGESA